MDPATILLIVGFTIEGAVLLVDLVRTTVEALMVLVRKRPSASHKNYPAQHKKDLIKRGFKEDEFNVAVIGRVSVGKSSLINALAGLQPTDAGAAAVGFSECTSDVSKYMMKGANLALWDIPGMGGRIGENSRTDRTASDQKKYAKNNYLYAMDAIILVYADSYQRSDRDMTQVLSDVVSGCKDKQLRLIVVKNKVDTDVLNHFKMLATGLPPCQRVHWRVEMVRSWWCGRLVPRYNDQVKKLQVTNRAIEEVKDTSSRDRNDVHPHPWFYISVEALSAIIAPEKYAELYGAVQGPLVVDELPFIQELTGMLRSARS